MGVMIPIDGEFVHVWQECHGWFRPPALARHPRVSAKLCDSPCEYIGRQLDTDFPADQLSCPFHRNGGLDTALTSNALWFLQTMDDLSWIALTMEGSAQ